jgi:hypothetical protein
LGRISFSGGSGATSDANVDGQHTWCAPGRWIEAGIRGQEQPGASGSQKPGAKGSGRVGTERRGGRTGPERRGRS